MIYRIEDYRMVKRAPAGDMAYCMIYSVGVFGNEVFAAEVSFAVQQVYDRYDAWVRLTKDEFDAFPGNFDALQSRIDPNRILLTRDFLFSSDITSFDSDLLGPAPLGAW